MPSEYNQVAMPRQSRIDFPGALHHIMVRGIERRNIFKTERDQKDLLERLSKALTETQTPCYAYALMSNHLHLLLQTGPTPISKVMQSLLTGYAVSYNLRHGRTGKLYQNRFKSILCDKEEYLLQLIRYIHLNPIRVNLASNLDELDTSPLTGHSIMMGKRKQEEPNEGGKTDTYEWFDADESLSRFGESLSKARQAYRDFIKNGIGQAEETDLSGGGLIRSMGGVWEVVKASRDKKRQKEFADERILGGGGFVEAALKHAGELESRTSRLQRKGWDFKAVLNKVAREMGVESVDLLRRGRQSSRSEGRALLCKWMVEDLGYTRVSVAKELGITGPSVGELIEKGRQIEEKKGIRLDS
ncbi:transposase [Planctomycetota bacterium]